jgi:dienelactone hydrolase
MVVDVYELAVAVLRPRPIALAFIALLGLAGCGGHKTLSATRTTPDVFAYDASAPLDFVDHGVVLHRGNVSVHDVSFTSGGQRVDAYLVEGKGIGRRPGLVLVHGSGGDRSELLGPALELAGRGFVAMTITAPSTAHPPPPPTSNQQLVLESKAVEQRDVIAVRRAADVLSTLSIVDPKRLGYLGWSAGAKTGAIVAAADPRFKALALLSAGADKLSEFVKAAPAPLRGLVQRDLGSVDPLRYIALARPGSVLLLDGRKDEIVPRPALLNMIHAAPKGTTVDWFPTGHALSAAAYEKAFAWLVLRLNARG